MIATYKETRDIHSGNPISVLEVNGGSYTFPGLNRMDRADALLEQLGFQKRWKQWKRVGGCNHAYCKHYLRIRVER